MKPTIEVLREARALIDTPEKWGGGGRSTVGLGDSVRGIYCPSGAMAKAACGNPWRDDAAEFRLATDALKRALGVTDESAIWRWNDALERTHADVLAAFDKAIASAEAHA